MSFDTEESSTSLVHVYLSAPGCKVCQHGSPARKGITWDISSWRKASQRTQENRQHLIKAGRSWDMVSELGLILYHNPLTASKCS